MKKVFLYAAVLLLSSRSYAQQVSPTNNIPVVVTPGTPASVPYPGLQNMTSIDTFNYIRTSIPDKPITSLTGNYIRLSTSFYDGLGRPLQTVAKNAHALGSDIIQHHVYDSMGRERYQYLPIAQQAPFSHGGYMRGIETLTRNFYDNQSPDEPPYSRTDYERTPLGRTTGRLAPGAGWVGAGRGTKMDYRSNEAGEVRLWKIADAAGSLPVSTTTYDAGALYVTRIEDEDGKVTFEYKDKMGRLVLRKQFAYDNHQPETAHNGYACTYYVYDQMGRQRFTISPQAVAQCTISGNTWSINAAVASGLCFQFTYDQRGRLIEKRIPGKEWEYFVYDGRDRLIMSQDGNLRANDKWQFTVYDLQDRPLFTGIYKGNATDQRAALQAGIDSGTPITDPTNLGYYHKNYSLIGVYPTNLFNCAIRSQIYYDDYSQLTGFSYDPTQFVGITLPLDSTVLTSKYSARTRGLVTGMKTTVQDPENPGNYTWLTTVNYYDDRARLIQSQSENIAGGIDISSNIYYFQGMLWKNILRHQNPRAQLVSDLQAGSPHTEIKLQTTSNRNLKPAGGNDMPGAVTQQIDSGLVFPLVNYSYDHLGRTVVKQMAAANVLQEYNMRGFLNHIDVANTNNIADSTHLFEENLYYDKGFGSRLFNGNIAGITWRKAGNNAPVEAYGYSYDMLNRLNHAEYRRKNALGQWSNAEYDYTASGMDYDLNGNIQHMNQRGIDPPAVNTPIDMDQLSYTYAAFSNQLVKVQDAVLPSATPSLPDFKDNANAAIEYSYDPNGNMLTDANKGITTAITYNEMNKPMVIQTAEGSIKYYYDAEGNRLKKVLVPNSGPKETYTYIGNFVYKNDTLQYFMNTEGRARPVINSAGELKFTYDYFVKDHLGNVRSTVNAEPLNENYLARHEISMANVEQLVFDNIPNVRDGKPGSTDPEDRMAARLNGSDKRIGTAIMLKTMPGDRFVISTDAFYEDGFKQDGDGGPEALVESLTSALMGGNTYTGVPIAELPENVRTIKMALNNPSLFGQLAQLSANDDPDRPKAHLNVLFFDDKLQLKADKSIRTQVPWDGMDGWGNFGPVPPSNVFDPGVVSDGVGVVLIFVDNESFGKDVWFDNIRIEHYTGKVLEEDHYYPYGLTVKVNENLIHKAQPYKYNGKELENRFGLEMYDYGARMQDPQLGVWHSIDPLAEQSKRWSPYNYAVDNPVRFIDPDGRWTVEINGNKAKEATQELQKSTSLKITRDEKTGQLSATGEAKTKNDKKLLAAINDKNVDVKVTAEDTKTTKAGRLYIGGAFGGNTVTKGANGNTVVAEQEINPVVLEKMSTAHNKPGADVLHEVTEAYEGALMSQKSGVSSPAAGLPGSVYPQAHNSAANQSGPVYQRIYDASGNQLQMTPSGGYPASVQSADWYVDDQKNNKVIIQTLP